MNDARFLYDGTTWTLTESDFFSYPLNISYTIAGDTRRSYEGTADKYVRYSKTNLSLTWEHVGTAAKDHTHSWVTGTGTVTLECYAGTWNCHAMNSGYSVKNVSLDVWNISVKLEEI